MDSHYHAGDKYPCQVERQALKDKVKELKSQIVQLQDITSICPQCEEYAKKIDSLKQEMIELKALNPSDLWEEVKELRKKLKEKKS